MSVIHGHEEEGARRETSSQEAKEQLRALMKTQSFLYLVRVAQMPREHAGVNAGGQRDQELVPRHGTNCACDGQYITLVRSWYLSSQHMTVLGRTIKRA